MVLFTLILLTYYCFYISILAMPWCGAVGSGRPGHWHFCVFPSISLWILYRGLEFVIKQGGVLLFTRGLNVLFYLVMFWRL